MRSIKVNKKLILGLDLGITSVGWGIITDDFTIVDQGVRLFDESTADGNKKRREYRGNRRLLRRRRARILRMYKYLEEIGVINDTFSYLDNPYEIRVKGLSKKLSNDELATALLHITKRRGSSLEVIESDADNKDEQSAKKAIQSNLTKLREEKLFIAQIQLQRHQDETQKVRGHHNIFKTEDYLKEVERILSNQDLTKEQNGKILEIIGTRRKFTEGPGSIQAPTPYGRFRPVEPELKQILFEHLKFKKDQRLLKETFTYTYEDKTYKIFKNGIVIPTEPLNLIDLMRGKCSIYTDQFRASKRSFSAELYNLLNELNNIRFILTDKVLSQQEKEEIIEHVLEKGDFTYAQFKKKFNVQSDDDITGSLKDNKNIFSGFKKLHKIFKTLKLELPERHILDQISDVLTNYPTIEDRTEQFNHMKLDKKLIESLVILTGFNGTHALSYKALNNFIPMLIAENLNQQQLRMKYDMAQQDAIDSIIYEDDAITNPVVRRVQREAQKVIQELIKIYGNFDSIVIETTRDKNTKEQVDRIKQKQKKNRKLNLESQEIIEAAGYSNDHRVSAILSQKIRLYNEQNQRCAYTGEVIDIGRLIRDPKSYEIDHIIPYSISFDDSLNNKVLVTHEANQLKGNRTPFGYFSQGLNLQHEINNYTDFKRYVESNPNYNRFKKANLLFEKDITKYSTLLEFKNRNLNDTSYAIRSFMTHLKRYFKQNNIPTNVFTMKGKQTNLFRNIAMNQWYRNNPNQDYTSNPFYKSRNFFKHHAIDALIVAGLFNQNTFKKFYQIEIHKDDTTLIRQTTGEVIDTPFEDEKLYKFFNQIAELEDEQFKFSWKIDSKPNRSISDQTIYSTRRFGKDDYIIKKDNIYDMNKEKAKKFFEKVQDQEKLLMYQHDPETFNIILKAYEQYQHETYPFKTYRENHGPLRKYAKNNHGPIVTNVKYMANKFGNAMDLSDKYSVKGKKVVKLQLSPYRIDIYFNNEQYKFVTVRYYHLMYDFNLRKYTIRTEMYEELLKEKNITPDYKFQFSLVRNNIFEIHRKTRDGIISERVRFIGTNSDANNLLEVKPISYQSEKRFKPGVSKNVVKINKYNVSVTGKISKVKQERLKLTI